MAATFALKAFFDGIGKTHIHLVSAVAMNGLNIVLCLLLIFGNASLGIPKYGIAGAGMAGFVSTYVGLAIMLGYALLPEYRRRYRPFAASKLSAPLIWSILRLSIPSAVATIAITTGFALFYADRQQARPGRAGGRGLAALPRRPRGAGVRRGDHGDRRRS